MLCVCYIVLITVRTYGHQKCFEYIKTVAVEGLEINVSDDLRCGSVVKAL
jgi:hypothetical protein